MQPVQRSSAQQSKGVARLASLGTDRLAEERSWSASIGRRPESPRVVAFTAGKGGVGTSTCAAATALTIAALWPGAAALADTGNGTASTGRRIGGVAAAHAAQFAAGVMEPLRVDGLTIVDGAPWDTPLTRPTLARVIADLREDHLYTILDVGDDAGEIGHGALSRVDQVVVVTTRAPDAIEGARRTLQRLENIDEDRARTAVVALTGIRRRDSLLKRDNVDLPQARRIVQLPWDASLDAGASINAEHWRRGTRAAFLELAAAISEPA